MLVTVGGLIARPLVVEGRVEAREHLCLTVSFDHEIVDRAPAAHFPAATFARLLTSGEALPDLQGHPRSDAPVSPVSRSARPSAC